MPPTHPSGVVASSSSVAFAFLMSAPSFPYSHLPSVYRDYKADDPDWELTRDSFLTNAASWGAAINTFNDVKGDYLTHLMQSYDNDCVWVMGLIHSVGDLGGAVGAALSRRRSWCG